MKRMLRPTSSAVLSLLVMTSSLISFQEAVAATSSLKQCVELFSSGSLGDPSASNSGAKERLNGQRDGRDAKSPELSPQMRDLVKADLKGLLASAETNYGPRSIKQQTIGLVWSKYKQSVLSSLGRIHSMTDFHNAIADLFNGLNDAHVSVSLPSTLRWSLPIQLSAVDGKIVVNYIESSNIRGVTQLPSPGDELIAVNGQSLNEYQKSSAYFNKYGNDLSNRGFFARLISSLSEERGFHLSELKSPDVVLRFKRIGKNGQPEEFDTRTSYTVEGVGLIDFQAAQSQGNLNINRRPELRLSQRRALARRQKKTAIVEIIRDKLRRGLPLADVAAADAFKIQFTKFDKLLRTKLDVSADSNASADVDARPPGTMGVKLTMGQKAPFYKLPADFQELKLQGDMATILNADNLLAGVFMRDGQRVGYLRVPAYELDMPETMLASLRYHIANLEANSDYLIVDQTSNPGGMVAYSDLFVKHLVGKYDDSKHLNFLVKPNQSFLREFAEMIDSIQNDPTMLTPAEKSYFLGRFRADYARINQAFQSGADLSEPISFRTMSEYFELGQQRVLERSQPMLQLSQAIGFDLRKDVVYSKKVFFWINEFDASGGDETPAVLQDYGRVTLVGTRTMGAGGSVEEFLDRVASTIKYRLTTSLMYRKGGKFVENFGVQPDVPFALQAQDYKEGFTNTFERFMKLIDTQRAAAPKGPNQ